MQTSIEIELIRSEHQNIKIKLPILIVKNTLYRIHTKLLLSS